MSKDDVTKNVKIPGHTLHGDYYLSDRIILRKNWKEACEMKEEVTLPFGKVILAHTLSKEELESISKEERGIKKCWYWTSSGNGVWYVHNSGVIICNYNIHNATGGVRLGFKNPFIN